MQLLQNFELVSWKLPPKWQIVLTANPDGGDYSVTPIDDAMLTRMLHISMEFDVKDWAKWAEENDVDARGINFALMHPEVIDGERTTPRSLVQFLETIRNIQDLQKELIMVKLLADSCLGKAASDAFVNHVRLKVDQYLDPEQLLASTDFEKEIIPVLEGLKTVGAISALCNRLVSWSSKSDYKLTDLAIENLKKIILAEILPSELKVMLVQDLGKTKKTKLKNLTTDPEIGQLLLNHL